jgi:hypothetical protein
VDTGSGYNAQNDVPVHVALAQNGRVDVEAVYPAAGRRLTARQRDIVPSAQTIAIVVK